MKTTYHTFRIYGSVHKGLMSVVYNGKVYPFTFKPAKDGSLIDFGTRMVKSMVREIQEDELNYGTINELMSYEQHVITVTLPVIG